MAEGTARSFDRSGVTPETERRSRLRLVARNDEAPPAAAPMPLSATDAQAAPAAAPLPLSAPDAQPSPVLSNSTDLMGIGPAGWIGAGLLYAGVVAAALLLNLTVTPPEPWPDSPTVFRVIFEPPPKPPEPAPAPPAAAPEPPQTAALTPPEPPKVEPPPEPPPPPAATVPPPPPEPAPPPVAVAPSPPPPEPAPPVAAAPPSPKAALPLPPPPKPPPRPALAKPHPPRAAVPAAPPVPHRSTEERRVAALPPPSLPIEPPRPISAAAGNPKPVYPAMARRRGLQGRVVLHVEVSVLGAPIRVNVLSSSGHAILDEAALRAVSEWRFIPARRGGTPIVAAVDVPIQFRLEE